MRWWHWLLLLLAIPIAGLILAMLTLLGAALVPPHLFPTRSCVCCAQWGPWVKRSRYGYTLCDTCANADAEEDALSR